MDGFEVLRRLRAGATNGPMPVLVLTARDAVDDRVRGLDLGADDYMVKPFAMPELTARVRALLRRSQAHGGPRIVHGPLAARHGGAARLPEKRAARARGARMGGARGAARARWRRSYRRKRSSRRSPAGARTSRRTRSRSTSRGCARSSSPPGSRSARCAVSATCSKSSSRPHTRQCPRAAYAHTCCACCCRRSRPLLALGAVVALLPVDRAGERGLRPGAARHRPRHRPRTCARPMPTTGSICRRQWRQALRTDRYDKMFYRVLSPSGTHIAGDDELPRLRAQRRHTTRASGARRARRHRCRRRAAA